MTAFDRVCEDFNTYKEFMARVRGVESKYLVKELFAFVV